MDIDEVVKRMPSSSIKPASERLISILLSSRKADALPASLVREILSLAKRELLASPEGVKVLLKASMLIDAEKALSLLEELGCRVAASALKELQNAEFHT